MPPGSLANQQDLSPKARWLFRTLRAAELTGPDPGEILGTAIAAQDLAGARDIAAVLDARIRPRVYPLLPQLQGPWAERVPNLPYPHPRAYLAQIAAMMDDRTRRLGQHAAQTTPACAITALGPVPGDHAARRDWQTRASVIGAYRETYGYDHPDDPIGPEPCREATEQRTAWYQAFTALGQPGGPDLRTLPDGHLWLIRATPTPPRPPGHPARRQRATARRRQRRPQRHPRRRRSRHRPQSRRPRHHAIAADAELRRRHPDTKIEPLHSAEPAPVSDAEQEQLHLAPGKKASEIAAWIRDLATQRQAFHDKIEERQRLKETGEDPDWGELGEVYPVPGRDSILQPPKPQITPSARILQLATQRDAEPEAAD